MTRVSNFRVRLCGSLWLPFALMCALEAQQIANDAGPSDAKARLEGHVLSAVSNQPLGNVKVRLRTVPSTSPTDASLSTITDDSGAFQFRNVDSGAYLLTAERIGYVTQDYGARPGSTGGEILRLEPGGEVKSLLVALLPQATVSGSVVDEDGNRVSSATVTALAVEYGPLAKETKFAGYAQVNADGEFKVEGLAPGKYYIRVDTRREQPTTAIIRPCPPNEVFAPTFYPHAARVSDAAPIQIAVGIQVSGISIRARKVMSYCVTGQVSTPPGSPVLLALIPKGTFDLSDVLNHKTTKVNGDGSFQFKGVSPGDYVVQTERIGAAAGRAGRLVGRAEVAISDANIDDLTLPLRDAIQIKGEVTIEPGKADGNLGVPGGNPSSPRARTGAPQSERPSAQQQTNTPLSSGTSGSASLTGSTPPPPPPPGSAPTSTTTTNSAVPVAPAAAPMPGAQMAGEQNAANALAASTAVTQQPSVPRVQLLVRLTPSEWLGYNTPMAREEGDGTFQLSYVSLDKYRLEFPVLPPGAYVKSVKFNGRDVTSGELDLSSGESGRLEVLLSANAADASGTVCNSDGEPLGGITVSIWRAGTNDRPKLTRSDKTGSFSIGNLPPGKYFVVAWEEIDPSLARFRTFCAFFEGEAGSVELAEGAHGIVRPPVISAHAIAAIAAKL